MPPEHHVAGFAPVGIAVLGDLDGIKYNENFGKAILVVYSIEVSTDEPHFIHIDHHVLDDRPKTHALGSYFVGNTNLRSGSCHFGIDYFLECCALTHSGV